MGFGTTHHISPVVRVQKAGVRDNLSAAPERSPNPSGAVGLSLVAAQNLQSFCLNTSMKMLTNSEEHLLMCQTGRGSDRPVVRSLGHHYFPTFTKIVLFPANVKVLVEALKVVDAFARVDNFPLWCNK
jgi:hypothetical protein